jgi:hypothetical protein
MKLITEFVEEGLETIVEATEGGPKGYFIEGIFMLGDLKNRNGRIYPSATLEKEMKRYDEQFIKTNRALGELNHPQGPQVNPERASHRIVSMKREGANFIGKAKILTALPMGKIVQGLIDEGVKFGVSTRGLGSVKAMNGIMEVQDDFYLATVDIVTDPSGPDCFVNGIMENTDFYLDAASGSYKAMRAVEETVAEVKKTITRTVRRIDEAQAAKLFYNFIESLKLGNDDFEKDMAAVKAGKADASKMADKWGERGGAFLSAFKPKSKN